MTRNNHRSRIHEAIRARILRGEIAPGQKLVDHAIAAEMGVSRMPVREALMQLTSEGYLESTSRGFALPNLSPDRIAEVFTLRRLLEPHAATCAARDLGADQIAALEAALSAAEAAPDIAAFHRAAETFRNLWLSALRNAELRQAIQRYSGQVQSVRFATLPDAQARQTIVAGLHALLSAFRMGDGPMAADHMLRFIFAAEDAWNRQKPAKGAAR